MTEQIEALLPEFERERQAEDLRLKGLEKARISPWNPATTMRWDRDRARKRVNDLKQWCESWWKQRGFAIIWGNDAEEHQLPSADLTPISPAGPASGDEPDAPAAALAAC